MSDDIKKLCVFSLIFGLICGVAALLPVLGVIILLMMIFCSSFIIMVVMKKLGYLYCTTEQIGLSYGAIAGFTAFIGFSILFLPCSFILSLLFKESYYTGIAMILKSGFTLSATLIIFIGILCAMMNAFSGLASVYFFNTNKKEEKFTLDKKKKKNNGF